MRQIKVKFKAITHSGEKQTKTIELSIPDFEVIQCDLSIFGGIDLQQKIEELAGGTISIIEQEEEYLCNLDKTDLMDQFGWDMILDWEIVQKKPKAKKINKKEEFFLYVQQLELSLIHI